LYVGGTEVELTATEDAGHEFVAWGGCDTEPGGNCKVTMSSAKSVTAEFAPIPPTEHELSVAVTGEGKVDADSGPISGCRESSGTCSGLYVGGTEVELTATEDAGHEFVAWGGACSGSGACEVEMSEAKEVTAEFAPIPPIEHELNVAVTGEGEVDAEEPPTPTSGAISACREGSGECLATYLEGDEVALIATPDAGNVFVAWGGACSGSGACEVEMSEAKEVTATFNLEPEEFLLTVTISGEGSVESSPAGIACPGTCSAEYVEGEAVELTATPEAGWEFSGWSTVGGSPGSCEGAASPCEVTEAVELEATFVEEEPTPEFTLTVTLAGSGTGSVASFPGGFIECPPGVLGTCEAGLEEGTTLTLTATPAGGSEFTGWTAVEGPPGTCTGATSPCEVTMSEAVKLKATFELIPKFALTVTPVGEGSVESSPAGIACPGICSAEFEEGTTIILTATAAAGWEFTGWSGACTGMGTCEVPIDEVKEVTATFAPILTVIKEGPGTGIVTSEPAGINCGSECEASFEEGIMVTLTATPAAGSEFVGWSGSGCTGAGTCEVTVMAPKTVTATFDLEPEEFLLTVTKEGTGGGGV
ncbi:MAG: hypothetical protein FVQ83_17190, partial [Chloroflexi bacterium]|nr:hypothetical protein [Chloroflexota bacterium]